MLIGARFPAGLFNCSSCGLSVMQKPGPLHVVPAFAIQMLVIDL
jgi:hypothetical protein